MARIRLKSLSKDFEGVQAVRSIDLDIHEKEFIALIGPSGCGKSTTLRMISGLEDVTSGEIMIGDRVVNNLAPKDRNVAMVFQNYALYPHMNVFQNMSIALRLRKLPDHEIRRRVKAAADILDIGELMHRKPRQLSGGQRQRVAMGRAIVRNPAVFLFDEPLSNLDAKLRVQMRTEIKKIHQRVRTTVVYVTHDQIEAMTLADRIVVMNQGKIEQVAAPQQMYDQPTTRFVAEFIGSPSMNIIPCRVENDGSGIVISVGDGTRLTAPPDRKDRYSPHVGREMLFGIRPEHVTERRIHTNETDVDLHADVSVLEPLGVDTLVYIMLGERQVCARATPRSVSPAGSRMEFTVHLDHMHLIDPDTDLVV